MQNFHFSIPIALLCLLSCTTRPTPNASSVITIDIPGSIKNTGEVKLSDIASDIEFIQLETTPECLINSEQSECYIAGEFILVVSRKPVGAMLFDRKGKFIRRIGQVGKGPDEYTYIDAGCLDPRGRFIYLTDPFSNRFLKYSVDGKVLLQKPFNEYTRFRDIGKMKPVFIDQDHLAITPMGKGNLSAGFCNVLILDMNLTVTDSLLKSSDDEKLAVNSLYMGELNATEGGVVFWKPFVGSVVFLYPDGKVMRKYQLNLNAKQPAPELLSDPQELEQPPYRITMIRDLPAYLAIFGFTPADEFLSMVYDKTTGLAWSLECEFKCAGFEQRKLQVFNDDLIGLPFQPMWEVNYFEKIMYCWYDLHGKIDNQLECIRYMKVLLPERRDELISKIRSRKEYDNPMLIVMKMR